MLIVLSVVCFGAGFALGTDMMKNAAMQELGQ